ncbi:MAG: peroxiredoxin family protein [Pseudomonadota bacterium]
MVRNILFALAAGLLLAAPGLAQDANAPSDVPAADAAPGVIGPIVGAQAPVLDMVEAVGTEDAFATPSGNGTALVFVRSADWCPFCKTQLIELNDAVGPLSAAGWRLSALSYDSPAVLEAFASEHALDFVLLSDQGSDAIRAFDLLNEDMKPASRAYGIPHPAVVFIRDDGTVAAVLREEGYKERPSVESILQTATLLNEAAAGS